MTYWIRCSAKGSILAVFLALAANAHAATFFVDGANPASSDGGPGTEEAPYRTIGAAIAAHNGPGVTILVKPAVYPENIDIPKSGPFVLRGVGDGPVDVLNVSLSGRSSVVIDGLTIRRGLRIGGGRDVTITNNRITNDDAYWSPKGIYATACTNLRIASNTISDCPYDGVVFRDVTNSVFEDNDVCRNVNKGLVLNALNSGSNGNLIRRNRFFDNGASAVCSAYDYDNLMVQNLMWGNKHGIEHNRSSRFRHVGDVVWGNTNDGIWLKDGRNAISFANCIVAENGTGNSSAYNVYIDAVTPFPESNDNIFWYSNGQPPIRVDTTVYASLAAWTAATGFDTRSIAADPRFRDPLDHDFHLTQRSPAIDCANTSVFGWPATDAEGRDPMDDPRIPDTGSGPIAFADRGAFEFVPSTLAVEDGSPLATAAAGLMPVSPNPMRSIGRIEYVVARSEQVRLTIVDVQGRVLATLAEGSHSAGRYTTSWNGHVGRNAIGPGLYFLRLETPTSLSTKRFTLVR